MSEKSLTTNFLLSLASAMIISTCKTLPIRWGSYIACHIRCYSSVTSSQIQDIHQFLDYCMRNEADSKSTVFNGTLYELYTKKFLERAFHCKDLIKVGGKGDEGVDLIGKWDLSYFHNKSQQLFPNLEPETDSILHQKHKLDDINVLVQCKNLKSKLKPSLIKELTGIFYFHRHDPKNTFMFIVSPHILTPSALRLFEATDCPMIHIQISTLYNNTDDVYNLAQYQGGVFSGLYLNTPARRLLSGIRIQDILGENAFHSKEKLHTSLLK